MKNLWPLQPMAPKDIEFSERVKAADFIVEHVTSMCRILGKEQTYENEGALAACMVEMRNMLVQVRDKMGFRERGPYVRVNGEARLSFAEFAEGSRLATSLYLSTQEDRFTGAEWRTILETIETPLRCVSLLNDFLAVAHAAEHDTSIESARRTLQVQRDSRRSGLNVTDEGDPSNKDVNKTMISAVGLTSTFALGEKQIKNRLKKSGVSPEPPKHKNQQLMYDKDEAIAALDRQRVKRKLGQQPVSR